MLNKRPTVVVYTMALIHQELAQVSGRHVGRDLHHFAHAVLAEDLHDLHGGRGAPDQRREEEVRNPTAERDQRS